MSNPLELARSLIESDDPDKRILAYMVGAYIAASETEDRTPNSVVIMELGEEVATASLCTTQEAGLSLLLHGICSVAERHGFSLQQTQGFLAEAWGERAGMARVGRHSAAPSRRPSTRRGRGKR